MATMDFDDDWVSEVPGEVGLVALVGSHAYGTAREDSDLDFRGFYVAPTERFWDLNPPGETFDRKEPDLTLHEVGKFVKLAVAANPTVLEVLWAEPCYVHPRADHFYNAGVILRAHRHTFLSRRLLKTYGGYAMQQLRKAEAGTGGSRGVQHFRREKFLLHTYRLMLAGTHALRTGDLKVAVDDPDALWEKARQPLDRIKEDFARLDREMLAAYERSPLPEHPPLDTINMLLRRIRRAHLDGR
jgi:predicted nucleotidyltransferase